MIFLSANCTDDMKAEVKNVLNIDKEALAEKYLGLPDTVGQSTKETFEYMPTRFVGLGRNLEWKGGKVHWSGSVAEIDCTSCSNIPYELLFGPKKHL
ncbi:hypothetical protein PR202_ga02023 [Eleusine coracana subsp. coracana]|uniref:Uncharacterized protein n=1 Tax=Eleusine coracana subsp. coracana TaxID=191504 RepID=A0AAV5BHX8_ELECO|nr:hypothetical protein PR202_ga01336 [Eleusine coracana subsp. coracana]GJM86190.1 hypothetical protein PR202_ga02023 [Eleusine coracana subsp. coracana]